MPGTAECYYTETIADASPDRATEVAVLLIEKVSTDIYGQTVLLFATVQITPGADTTDIAFQWRRGSATGDVVGNNWGIPIASTDPIIVPITAKDFAPVGVGDYVLCLTQTGASADATINVVSAVAIAGG